MAPDRWYFYGIVALAVAGVASSAALLFIPAPYGRYQRTGWGPTIPARLGWLLQELPAPLLFAIVFFRGEHAFRIVPLSFLLLWELHYGYRTFVYPLRLRPGAARMPVSTVAMAIVFNGVNAALNAYAISHGALRHVEAWFGDPRFVAGVALFAIGWFINHQSDAILRRLRKPGETGYAIPRGGLFRFVSCPNYLGEIVEWCGWALATWTYAGFAFAFFTAANLVPRAISHHRWYREKFAEYPPERRAIIPGVL
jgi:protein-S-isoprenylcysteine O-methyltransferase Ste14